MATYSTSSTVLALLVAVAVGTGVGYWFAPGKTVTKTVTVEVEKAKVDRNIVTKTVKTMDKTGKPVETTVIVDKSKETTDKTANSTSLKAISRDKMPNWRFGVTISPQKGGNVDLGDLPMVLGGQIDRRIFGPFWLGVFGDSKKNFGLGFSITF